MQIHRILLPAALVAGLAVAPQALGGAGDKPVNTEQVEDFRQTSAQSFADYHGRAVLVEFFAYW